MRETPGDRIGALLDELSALAQAYGERSIRQDVAFIAEQLRSQSLAIAAIGQFKRGKSTLLNALLGANVLPTGRLPSTGVVTRVLHGIQTKAIVHYLDGRSETVEVQALARYVTEEYNPANVRGVERVDVTLPSEFLRGIALIDTPGIGSTLLHNTQAAHGVVGRIDLALFVTGPEPPITQEELEFLEKVAKFAERVFVVVAKIDRATDGAEEIVQFTQGMLEQVNSGGMRLFAVDSTQQDGRLNLLRRAILETLKEEGDRVLQRARGRRVRRVGAAIRQSVELRRAAVLLPRQERELARAGFGELIVETQERADDLVHAIDRFPDEEMHYVDALLQRLSDEAARRIAPEAFAAEAPEGAEGEIYRCVGAEEQVWSERVFCEMQSHIESRQNTIVRRTAELERQFLQAGCEVLGLNAPVTRDDLEFGKRQAASRLSGPMPTTGLEIVTSSLLGALPAPARAQALRRRFSHLIPQLLDRSRGRVRSAALEYLTNWRYSYRAQIAQRLAEARRVVEDAFAQASQPGGSEEATQLQVQRIRHDSERLEALLAQLADASASD